MTKILIAGQGGQGVQSIAEILATAAFFENKHATYIPNFGVEQRGGSSLAYVIIDEKPIAYPKFEKADILALLSEESRPRIKNLIGPQTKVILGPAVNKGLKTKLLPKVWNIVVLGQILKTKPLVGQTAIIKAMKKRFKRQFTKKPSLIKLNLEALENNS